jgi:hypothetical protein
MLVAALLMAPAILLLRQAHRSRQAPELWAALYFVGSGVGIPLRIYGSSIFLENPELARTINLFGHLLFAAGAIAMTVFTCRVFHPSGASARRFGIATVVAILATTFYTLATGLESQERTPAMIATNFARLVPTYWAFWESFRYWRVMRRRVPLGLADPVVANRFLLWSIWTCAVSVLPSIVLGLRILERAAQSWGISTDPTAFQEQLFMVLRLVVLIVAPIAAGALSLSFFPPLRYLEYVRGRTTTPTAASTN